MPYHGWGGQEIEDPEMDEMRREAQTREGVAGHVGVDPHTARQDEVEARMERGEQQVADLEARLTARLERLADRLESAQDRTSRELDNHLSDHWREGSRR